MKRIIKNLFKPFFKNVPENIEKELFKHFPKAINVDWNKGIDAYEAVFYIEDVEYIAKISTKGEMLMFKKNLRISEVPELIQRNSKDFGEIMSAIAIYTGENISFELIIRTPQLVRFMLLFDFAGNLTEKMTV